MESFHVRVSTSLKFVFDTKIMIHYKPLKISLGAVTTHKIKQVLGRERPTFKRIQTCLED